MKQAQIDHAWLSCRSVPKERLDVNKICVRHGTESLELAISSRVTALLGENGSGKTSVLHSIARVIEGVNLDTHGFDDLQSIKGQFQGQQVEWAAGEHSASAKPHVEYIDVASDVHQIKSQLEDQSNIDEFLLQFGSKPLADKELGIYRTVCRRNYQKISVRELEYAVQSTVMTSGDPELGDTVFPLFEVQLNNGATYDNRGMGFGELCACYLVWRLLGGEKGAVFLLDEPDSHLSSKSRRGLTDFFAWIADEKSSWILFTSHSVEPIQQLEDSEILLIERPESSSPTRLDLAANKHEAMLHLGMTLSKRFLFAVEDVDSKQVVQQIFSRFLPELAQVSDVQIVSGGATQLAKFDQLFPKGSAACELIPVLDGDKRYDYFSFTNLLFLPGTLDPIAMALHSPRATAVNLAARLLTTEQNVGKCISNIAGVDHHDYCMALAQELNLHGVTTESVRVALVSAWFESPTSEEAFFQLALQIRHRIMSAKLRP